MITKETIADLWIRHEKELNRLLYQSAISEEIAHSLRMMQIRHQRELFEIQKEELKDLFN